jgi:PKD repeat protein
MKKELLVTVISIILIIIGLSGCTENPPEEKEKKYPSATFSFSIDVGVDESVLNAANIVLPILTSDVVNFSSDGSTDSDGNIVEYHWDFGDDNYGTGESVEHQYDSEGTYSVSLLVIDNDDLSNKITKTIEIESIPELTLDYSIIDTNNTESYRNGSLNISVIGVQNASVGVWEIISCITQYTENDDYMGWSCNGFSKNIVNLNTVIEIGSYQTHIDGTYFDTDSDKYVSVGDYIHYSYSYPITSYSVGKIKYILRLGSHSSDYRPELSNFTYDFT